MTVIKSETRETYVVVVPPRWELTPAPNDNPPMLDMFAAELVLETGVKWLRARNALAQGGKSSGHDLMRAYLDAEELHAGAIALYAAVTAPLDGYEDEECQLP
jgi:hypothetical protein